MPPTTFYPLPSSPSSVGSEDTSVVSSAAAGYSHREYHHARTEALHQQQRNRMGAHQTTAPTSSHRAQQYAAVGGRRAAASSSAAVADECKRLGDAITSALLQLESPPHTHKATASAGATGDAAGAATASSSPSTSPSSMPSSRWRNVPPVVSTQMADTLRLVEALAASVATIEAQLCAAGLPVGGGGVQTVVAEVIHLGGLVGDVRASVGAASSRMDRMERRLGGLLERVEALEGGARGEEKTAASAFTDAAAGQQSSGPPAVLEFAGGLCRHCPCSSSSSATSAAAVQLGPPHVACRPAVGCGCCEAPSMANNPSESADPLVSPAPRQHCSAPRPSQQQPPTDEAQWLARRRAANTSTSSQMAQLAVEGGAAGAAGGADRRLSLANLAVPAAAAETDAKGGAVWATSAADIAASALAGGGGGGIGRADASDGRHSCADASDGSCAAVAIPWASRSNRVGKALRWNAALRPSTIFVDGVGLCRFAVTLRVPFVAFSRQYAGFTGGVDSSVPLRCVVPTLRVVVGREVVALASLVPTSAAADDNGLVAFAASGNFCRAAPDELNELQVQVSPASVLSMVRTAEITIKYI